MGDEGIRQFSDVYPGDAAELPLLRFADLTDQTLVFYNIEPTSTVMGDCYRVSVGYDEEGPTHAVLTEAMVVVRQLKQAKQDGHLPIEATLVRRRTYYQLV